MRGIVEGHFGDGTCGELDLGDGSEEVAGRLGAADEVVGHDDVDCIFSAALGHVAGDAGGLRGQGDGVGDAAMAVEADLGVVGDGFGAVGDVVGVVAGEAGHLRVEEAGGFLQAVGGVGDLEGVGLLSVGWLEVELVVGDGFAGAEGKGGAVEEALVVGLVGGGLQVALVADFKLAISGEVCGVDDRGADEVG